MKASLIIVFAVSYGVMAALMGAIIWQIIHDKPCETLAAIAVLWAVTLPTLSGKTDP